MRERNTSAKDIPVARAARTPRTWAPVLYSHFSPGCAISGSDPRAAIHVSGSGCVPGSGGPSVHRFSSFACLTTGHGSGAMNMSSVIPKPNVKVSSWRTVIGPSAGTVSSREPGGLRSTLRSASSGSQVSTRSSKPNTPSSTRAMVAAPVTTLVVDAMRYSESRWAGGPPMCSVPNASTWTWSWRATRATSPGILSDPTWLAATSPNPSRPDGDSGSGTVKSLLCPGPPEERRNSKVALHMSDDGLRRQNSSPPTRSKGPSAAGAGGTEAAAGARPGQVGGDGPVVTGVLVLLVFDRCRCTAGDGGHGGQE